MRPRATGAVEDSGVRSGRVRPAARALSGALAISLLLPAVAFGNALTPESGGSPNADEIDALYKVFLVVGLAVFLGVPGVLVYSLVRFKARRGGTAPQIHGHTRLEIGWTVAAVALVAALSGLTLARLPSIAHPPPSDPSGAQVNVGGALYASLDQPPPPDGRALHVAVTGQQYIWRFTYPNGAFSYEELVVPVHTTVVLDITSQDVAHSWWVPKLGGKFDAVPGYTNHTWLKIARPSVYRGQCAELCGENHADMRAHVRALPVARYEAWVARQKRMIADAERALRGAPTGQPIPGS